MKTNIAIIVASLLAIAAGSTIVAGHAPTYSAATKVYYASPSGSGSCSSGDPCRFSTIAKTYQYSPHVGAGSVTINLATGTYTDTGFEFWTPQIMKGAGTYIAIIGTPITSTLAGGPTTGTCTWGAPSATARATCTDGAATWTTNDLRRRYLRLGMVNSTYPDGSCGTWTVHGNTATAITLSLTSTSFRPVPGGCTGSLAYRVVEPGTILTGVSPSTFTASGVKIIDVTKYPQYTTGLPDGGAILAVTDLFDIGDYVLGFNGTSPMRQNSIILKWVKFAPSASTRAIVLGEGTDLTVDHVTFVGQDSLAVPIYAHGGNRIIVNDSYHLAAGSVAGPLVATHQGAGLPFISIRNSIGEKGTWFRFRGTIDWSEMTSNALFTPNGTAPVYLYNRINHARFRGDHIEDAGYGTILQGADDVSSAFTVRNCPSINADITNTTWMGASTDSSALHYVMGFGCGTYYLSGANTISFPAANSIFHMDMNDSVEIQDNSYVFLANGTGSNYLADYGYDAVNSYRTIAQVDAGISFGIGGRGLCGQHAGEDAGVGSTTDTTGPGNARAGCIKLGTL